MVKPPIFLFLGNDAYSKEKAIKDICSSLDRSSRQLDYKVFYGQDAEADDILSHLTTVPFLASKRFVVIKDSEKLTKESKARLAAYIKKPSGSSYLILESNVPFVPEEYAKISGYINIRMFRDPTGQDFDSRIKNFMASRGKDIDPDAVRELKELNGNDPLALSQELEKLAVFVGDKKKVGPGDVEAVVGKNITVSAFELNRTIDGENVDGAVKIVSDLLMSGKKHYEIVGLICWHLRRMLRAKSLQAGGGSDAAIANILKIGRRHYDEFFGQVRSTKLSVIRSRIKILLEADLDIKRARFDPALALEFAIIRLCLSR